MEDKETVIIYQRVLDNKNILILKHCGDIRILTTGPRGGGKLGSYHTDDFPKFVNKYRGVIPENILEMIEEDYFIHKL